MTVLPISTPQPIEDHGLVGDLRTAALVARDGAVTFLCLPEFDSPTVFASLLDPAGGTFRILPRHQALRASQMYLPDTNILITRFMSENGIAELTDLMPAHGSDGPQRLQRRVRVIRGEFDFDMVCAPRFDYGRRPHALGADNSFVPDDDSLRLRLRATVPLRAENGDLHAGFRLRRDEEACFLLEVNPENPASAASCAEADAAFAATLAFWHRWVERSHYAGRWREVVTRSALVLKLLTSAVHGAPVAAATFGLPEEFGGERNWDYRYVWIRDASFAMYAFIRRGLVDEAEAFVDWIGARARQSGKDERLHVAYALDGRSELPEQTLDHWEGHRQSRPVLIGNAAAKQFQLDIYGELMDSVYLANKYGRSSSYEDWRGIVDMVAWLGGNWRRPDAGIWEGRGPMRAFLHSRVMCWVAVDRAIRLAQKRSLPAPLPEWNALRLEIHASIHAEFWREDLRSFVSYPGADAPDGSMLLMPLVRFISPCDPRWIGTMALVRRTLVEDALVFRRTEGDRVLDGLKGEEGSFLACSFWYVECLARMGELVEARLLFEKLLGYANPLGLYAEELSPTGRHQGNYPQALTHLALISAASYLDRALGRNRATPWS